MEDKIEEEDGVQEAEEEATLRENQIKKIQLQCAIFVREAVKLKMIVGLKENHKALIAENLGIWLKIAGLRIYNKLVV